MNGAAGMASKVRTDISKMPVRMTSQAGGGEQQSRRIALNVQHAVEAMPSGITERAREIAAEHGEKIRSNALMLQNLSKRITKIEEQQGHGGKAPAWAIMEMMDFEFPGIEPGTQLHGTAQEKLHNGLKTIKEEYTKAHLEAMKEAYKAAQSDIIADSGQALNQIQDIAAHTADSFSIAVIDPGDHHIDEIDVEGVNLSLDAIAGKFQEIDEHIPQGAADIDDVEREGEGEEDDISYEGGSSNPAWAKKLEYVQVYLASSAGADTGKLDLADAMRFVLRSSAEQDWNKESTIQGRDFLNRIHGAGSSKGLLSGIPEMIGEVIDIMQQHIDDMDQVENPNNRRLAEVRTILNSTSKVFGLKEVLARHWCIEALIKAKIATDTQKAWDEMEGHVQQAKKLAREREASALHFVLDNLGKGGDQWQKLIQESVASELRKAKEQEARGTGRIREGKSFKDALTHTPESSAPSTPRGHAGEAGGGGSKRRPDDKGTPQKGANQKRHMAQDWFRQSGNRRFGQLRLEETDEGSKGKKEAVGGNGDRSTGKKNGNGGKRQTACRFGAKCSNRKCRFMHPERERVFRKAPGSERRDR